MAECLFCELTQGNIPADVLYQDQEIIAFRDISPQAPQHILVIPKKHIASLNALTETEDALLGRLIRTAQQLAVEYQIAETGYRVLINCNADGGQTVYHLHVHLLGGRIMRWPPG